MVILIGSVGLGVTGGIFDSQTNLVYFRERIRYLQNCNEDLMGVRTQKNAFSYANKRPSATMKMWRMRRTRCLIAGVVCCLTLTFLLALYPLQNESKPCSCLHALEKCDKESLRDIFSKLGLSKNSKLVLNNSTASDAQASGVGVNGDSISGDDPSWGPHKMAILVPFRDRLEELTTFVPYMHNFLNNQRTRHAFYVINQADFYRWAFL